MKLVCVSDCIDLTKGKVYTGQVVGDFGQFYFLTFNDMGLWETYDLHRFEPRAE